MNKLARLKDILLSAGTAVFFGGAGTSTESGIPDFRSASGLYHAERSYGYPPETLLSHDFLESEPEVFFRYYRENLLYPGALPNPAHLGLARLEREGRLSAVITQNIDGLHQRAGSKTVLELHGSVHRNYCVSCGARYDLDYILAQSSVIPRCERCGSLVRPDVVLYGEGLNAHVLSSAVEALANADVLIIGGTSLAVYPAASLVRYFEGDTLVMINRTPTPGDHMADLLISEPIGQVFAQILR